jgi:hypothetical protein
MLLSLTNNPITTIMIPINNDSIPGIVKNVHSAYDKRMQQIVKIKKPIPPKIILIDFIILLPPTTKIFMSS